MAKFSVEKVAAYRVNVYDGSGAHLMTEAQLAEYVDNRIGEALERSPFFRSLGPSDKLTLVSDMKSHCLKPLYDAYEVLRRVQDVVMEEL